MVGLTFGVVVLVGFWAYVENRGRKARAQRGPGVPSPDLAPPGADAIDAIDAIDDEKVFRLGIQRRPGVGYTIKDGLVWSLAPDGSPARPLTSTPFMTNLKFVYYLDEDGDVSRRRKTT